MTSANTRRSAPSSSNDLYNTPRDALAAAHRAGLFDGYQYYWDPCDGLGDISDYLKGTGKRVITSDIENHGSSCRVDHFIEDFLRVKATPLDVDCIIMNPPYNQTNQFIEHALTLCPSLIMFNRANILEGIERSTQHAIAAWPLTAFYSLSWRASCTKGVDREPTSNAVWYAWYHYQRGYRDDPKIRWLFRPEPKKQEAAQW